MYEDELRDLMMAVDVPASRVDVQQAIKVGRRKARVQTVMVGGVAVVVVAGTLVALQSTERTKGDKTAAPAPSASAVVAKSCVVSALELPKGASEGIISAIDPTGEIIGGYVDAKDAAKPAIWKKDRPGELLPGVTGVVSAVAADGTVVGFEANERDDSTGWVLRDGKRTDLTKVAGYQWSDPKAINAAGVIAGWVHGNSLDATAPVVWAADGVPHKLAVPAGIGDPGTSASMARDIADDGTVVGSVRGVPVVWKTDGSVLALAMPEGAQGGIAWAVAGDYAYGQAGSGPVRWDLRTGQVTKLPGESDYGAAAGTADGTALVSGDSGRPTVRVRPDGRTDNLPGLKDAPVFAMAMSADGRTVAGTSGEGDPVVWHCP